MKSFKELKKNLNLIRYIGSKFGTMYFVPNLPREKKKIIRHLDAELTEDLLPVYVELYDAINQWVESNSRMREYLFVSNLIEVGKDYVIRPFYVYQIDVRDYFDEDEPIEPPRRYFEMIRMLSEEMVSKFVENEGINPSKDTIIKRVLRKSLLGLSGKTIFEDNLDKFIMVEPKISIADLEEWQSIKESRM